MEASRLEELRKGIDSIDTEMVELLAKRFQLTEEVGVYKAANRLAAQDPGREALQFDKIRHLAEFHGLNPEYAASIFRRIMDVAIARHEELSAAYEQKEAQAR